MAAALTQTSTVPVARRRNPWIVSPVADALLVIGAPLLIVPALYGLSEVFSPLLVAGFVLGAMSTGHHLPGFFRAYGDPVLFERYRARFLLLPPLLFATVLWFTWHDLLGVAALVALWGIWHGFMQIYGFMRIYDAKRGELSRTTARFDWWMCASGFVAITLWSDASAARILEATDGAGLYFVALVFSEPARHLAAAVTAVVAVAYVAYTARRIRQGRPIAPLKLILLVVSLGFLYSSWILAGSTLLLGLAAWEAFHDVQYMAIAWAYNRRLVEKGSASRTLARFFRPRAWLVGVYVLLVLGYGLAVTSERHFAGHAITSLLFALVLTSAILHFYFDGFIWKLSQAKTRSDLGIESAGGGVAQALGLPPGSRAREWGQLALLGAPLALLAFVGANRSALEIPMRSTLVRVAPESTRFRLELGNAYLDRRRYADAIDAYQSALALEPGLAEAHDAWGRALAAQGRIPDAIAAYSTALEHDPAATRTSVALAELLVMRQQGDAALQVLRAALKHAPNDPDLATALSQALLSGPTGPGRAPVAETHAERAVRNTHAQRAEPLVALAVALAAQQRYDEAADALERARQTDVASRDPELAREIERELSRYRSR